MEKAVVVFSGGPDSTAAALWCLDHGYEPELLTFQFKGQAQYGELRAAMKVAERLNLHHTLLDFQSPMMALSPNVRPLMHAGLEPGFIDHAKDHRLPFGSGMVLTMAACYTLYHNKRTVVWGATADDSYAAKYEYSAALATDLSVMVTKSLGEGFQVLAPLSHLSKYQILDAFSQNADLFDITWSCKEAVQVQCGECHACTARRTAALLARLEDRTLYSKSEFSPPLSDDEVAAPGLMDEEARARLFGSEKPF